MGTKKKLVAAILAMLLVVIITWSYNFPHQKYIKLATLTEISYQPRPPSTVCSPACKKHQTCIAGSCGTPLPALTFTFNSDLPADVKGTLAIFKEFTASSSSHKDAAAVKVLIDALLHNGGVPFVPHIKSPNSVASNSMPARLVHEALGPITLTGTGVMWFAKPIKE